MNKFFDAFTRPINTSEGTHGGLLFIVGAYIVYMGISMIKNTLNGLSEMSLTLTCVLAGIMMLAGAAVAVLGIVKFIRGWKKEKQSIDDENDTIYDEGENE